MSIPVFELLIDDDFESDDLSIYLIPADKAIHPAEFIRREYPPEKPCPEWLSEIIKPFTKRP